MQLRMLPAIALIKTSTGKMTQLFSTFNVVVPGSSLKFNYCELDRAIALLEQQYLVGTLKIKVMQL